jgi:hypothetical protein
MGRLMTMAMLSRQWVFQARQHGPAGRCRRRAAVTPPFSLTIALHSINCICVTRFEYPRRDHCASPLTELYFQLDNFVPAIDRQYDTLTGLALRHRGGKAVDIEDLSIV